MSAAGVPADLEAGALRTCGRLARSRPGALNPWRKLSRLVHGAAHRQVNLDAPRRLPRSRLEHRAPPFGVARKKSGQAARSAALPRMAQDRLPGPRRCPEWLRTGCPRSAAPPGMGQDRLSKLARSPRTTPDTLSQPRRGIFETASRSSRARGARWACAACRAEPPGRRGATFRPPWIPS
jgi:hypothetical protein